MTVTMTVTMMMTITVTQDDDEDEDEDYNDDDDDNQIDHNHDHTITMTMTMTIIIITIKLLFYYTNLCIINYVCIHLCLLAHKLILVFIQLLDYTFNAVCFSRSFSQHFLILLQPLDSVKDNLPETRIVELFNLPKKYCKG